MYLESSDSYSHSSNDHSIVLNQLLQLVKAAVNTLEEKELMALLLTWKLY